MSLLRRKNENGLNRRLIVHVSMKLKYLLYENYYRIPSLSLGLPEGSRVFVVRSYFQSFVRFENISKPNRAIFLRPQTLPKLIFRN